MKVLHFVPLSARTNFLLLNSELKKPELD